jgi:ribonuclease G
MLSNQNEGSIRISLHPYLYAYFTCGLISKRFRWFFKYNKWVTLEQDSSLGVTEYKFTNKIGEEIELL